MMHFAIAPPLVTHDAYGTDSGLGYPQPMEGLYFAFVGGNEEVPASCIAGQK